MESTNTPHESNEERLSRERDARAYLRAAIGYTAAAALSAAGGVIAVGDAIIAHHYGGAATLYNIEAGLAFTSAGLLAIAAVSYGRLALNSAFNADMNQAEAPDQPTPPTAS